MLKKFLIFFPPYAVWAVVAVYLVFGLCRACVNPGPLQWLALILYTASVMIPVWLFIKWLTAVPGWMKKVEAEGKQATATILSVKNTGTVINNTVALVKLHLRVEPPDEAPFEVSQEKEVSMITGLRGYDPGTHVKVKYDPNNKHHFIISDANLPAGHRATPSSAVPKAFHSRSDLTKKLAELSKLHKSGELSDAEFAAAKKKLLG